MPYGGAVVSIIVLDFDEGDDQEYEEAVDITTFLRERLVSFKFTDRDKGKDKVELELRNEDFKMLQNPVFAKGQKLLVTWGWPGKMAVPRRMVVKSVKGSNPVKITGFCMVDLFDKKKVTRFKENVTDSEWVHEIAEEYGYTGNFVHIQETETRHDITQPMRTDARQLHKMGRKNGFVFYIDETGLHWHKKRTDVESVKTYIYKIDPNMGDILSEPSFDVNMSKGISKVKVVARDPRTKKELIAYGGPDDTEIDSLGETDEMGSMDESVEEQGRRAARMAREDVRYAGIKTQGEAQVEADARYTETAKRRYKMKMTVIGDVKVGAKKLIELYGINEMFDGYYYIKQISTIIQGGAFRQELSCRKDAVNKLKTAKGKGKGKKQKTNSNVVSLEGLVIGVDVADALMKKKLKLIVGPDGMVTGNYEYTDGSGEDLYNVSAKEMEGMSEAVLIDLAQKGAQSIMPDSSY